MPCDLDRGNEVSQEVGYGDYYEVEVDISPSHYMYLLFTILGPISSAQALMITHLLADVGNHPAFLPWSLARSGSSFPPAIHRRPDVISYCTREEGTTLRMYALP